MSSYPSLNQSIFIIFLTYLAVLFTIFYQSKRVTKRTFHFQMSLIIMTAILCLIKEFFALPGLVFLLASTLWTEKSANQETKYQQEDFEKKIALKDRELHDQKELIITSSKMSALGEMAAGIAHEINNPLAIIKGYLGVITKQATDQKIDHQKLLSVLEKCRGATDRISHIIEGLHAYSRNAQNDTFTSVTVKEIIDDTLGLCQRFIESQSINLSISYQKKVIVMGMEITETPFPDQIYITCRPSEIVQILINLISNAKDAIENAQEKWIRLEVVDDDFSTSFKVIDCGHGIDAKVVSKIMDPFFTTKELGKGTGLGLSISKGIAENHHGELVYDNSAPNTTFVLKLPKNQPEAQKNVG